MSSSNLVGFFDSHYVFGDSLSDVNNFTALDTQGPIPRLPLFKDGRFTNGLDPEGVWTDYYSTELNLELSSFYQGGIAEGLVTVIDGINFALGGDKSDDNNISPLNDFFDLGLSNQINQFDSLVTNGIIESIADSLTINWIGANDYLAAAFSPPPEVMTTAEDAIAWGESGAIESSTEIPSVVTQVVNNLNNSLTTVLELGAQFVVVPNMIDLGLTPLAIANEAQEILTDLSVAHNQTLATSLNQLSQSYPNAKIIEVDIYSFFNEEIFPDFDNQTTGITATNLYPTPMVDVTVDLDLLFGNKNYEDVSEEAEDYLWWDSVHPTTRVHELISEYILEVIEENVATRGTRGRDILTGGEENNLFIASTARDILTGGGGNNVFVYNNMTDAGDIITDFTVGQDRLNMIGVLNSIGYTGNNPLVDGYITFSQRGANTILNIDANGFAPGRERPYITLENVVANEVNNPANFIFS